MKPRTLMTVGGIPVFWDGKAITFTAGMTIDADGAPRCYHPADKPGLDYLANAGYPGNWWALVCGRNGQPLIQDADDPAPGFYVSMTAYEHANFKSEDPRRYLNSETVPFVVVPGPMRSKVRPVVLGCRALVRHRLTGKSCEAVVGDIGPSTHLGEGSIALARKLGVPSNPRRGGVSGPVIEYTIFPGVAAEGFQLLKA